MKQEIPVGLLMFLITPPMIYYHITGPLPLPALVGGGGNPLFAKFL
jgi:hypothetical protein